MPTQDEAQGLIEPVQGRSKLSTRRLLEAAGALIAERGYEQASLAAIGARAGYSRGLVTTRFGTKENLLNVLIDRVTSDWVEHNVLPEIADLSGLDAIETYLDSVADQLRKDPEPLAVLWALTFEALRSSSQLRERFIPFHQGVIDTIAGYLRTGVEDGSIRSDIDPEREAILFTATLRGIAYHWLLLRDDDQLFDQFAALHEQVEERLRGKGRRKPSAKKPAAKKR